MRIVAIDASALGGGSVSASVEAAARAAMEAGGDVHRIRLYSMPSGHGVAEVGTAVSRGLEETVAVAVEEILASDGIIVGVHSTPVGPNAATKALLRRLAACFAGNCLERGYHGRPTRLAPGRRVGLLTSTPSTASLASPQASTFTTTVRVKRCLSRGGLRLFGCVAIADVPGHPLRRDRAMAASAELGGALSQYLLDSCAALPAWVERRSVTAPRRVRVA